MTNKRYLGVERKKSLIPGLPDDVARHCLAKVPRIYNRSMRSVSRSWKKTLESGDFFEYRRRIGVADAWLVVILKDLVQSDANFYCIYDLASKSMLLRAPLPFLPSPDRSDQESSISSRGFAAFKTAAVGNLLIAIESTASSCQSIPENHTMIFDTVTNRWRRRSSPVNARSSQFVVAATNGTVYVAGGCDGDGDFIPAVEAYDVASDTWTSRSPMPYALDRVDGEVVYRGKILVRGFTSSSRCVVLVYDPVKDSWDEDRSGINGMDHGELLATSNALYNLTALDTVYKLVDGEWILVGRIQRKSAPASTTFNAHSPRAFAFRDEVFVLGGELNSCIVGDGELACHGLFVGSSWSRSGAVVAG